MSETRELPLTASLFVSTYEMPKHLELVCAALGRQSFRDFEIFFCDDGSGPETRRIIEGFIARSGLWAQHLWQEHQGFRKCRILNQALRLARGKTCVFLDGDCVPHRDYVRDHVENQKEGFYLAGRRVELGPEFSATLDARKVSEGLFDWPRLKLLASVLRKDSEYFNRSIRIPFPAIRKLARMDRIVDLKGCNYSVSRDALLAINGFDEEYEGYGREDTDVEIRLKNYGLRIKSLKGLALQYHVWHPRRAFTPANDRRLEELQASGRFRCENGVSRATQ